MPSEPILFFEKQSLRQWHVRIVLAFPAAAVLFIACRQIVWHKPWGSPPLSNEALIFLTVMLLGVYLRLITVKLVTVLRPQELSFGLRGLWRPRHIPLDRIRSAAVVTYDPVVDFGGYGIRSGRRAKAYIASGNRGVELVLDGAPNVLIGSQNPADLARKIEDARGRLAVRR